MIVLLSGGPPAVRHALPPWAGGLVTPTAQHDPTQYVDQGRPWAIDNAAYTHFDPVEYLKVLERWRAIPGCQWVAVPDVPYDHAATLRRWHEWAGRVASFGYGYSLAFVVQDGATPGTVPWPDMAALFVGGSTRWKLGSDAALLIRAAQDRGLWVHMGRVNTAKRVHYAHSLKLNSVDGMGWSRFWNEKVRQCAPYLHSRQSRLEEVA